MTVDDGSLHVSLVQAGGLLAAVAAYTVDADGVKVALSAERSLSDWSDPVEVTTPAVVSELPWAMPSRAVMAASDRDVLAYFHTFPTYPRSGSDDYEGWLDPTYNGNQFYGAGGRWRQRPYPIISGTISDADRVAYAKDDIATAAAIGINAFTFNILGGAILPSSSDYFRWAEHIMPYYNAAAEFSEENTPGFTICPNASMLSFANNSMDATYAAEQLKPLLVHAAAYKRNGRPVVMLYNVDNFAPQWYQDFYDHLFDTYGISVSLIPSHQAASPTGGSISMDSYLPLFQAGVFTHLHGWTSPGYTVSPTSYYSAWRTWCQANGNIPFVGAAGPRWENDRADESPAKQIEGRGLTILQNSWMSSINNGDPLFQITSWSDHLESHNIRPSTGYQYVPYDITAYYLAWYKTGTAPTITRDAIFYAHRMHKGTEPYDTTKQTVAYKVSNGPALDQVLTTVFLVAPADVIVTIGGVDIVHADVPAGVTTLADPMESDDTPEFRIERSGSTVASVTSAFPTRTDIVWQDLLYRMGSSTRAPMAQVQSDLPQDRV